MSVNEVKNKNLLQMIIYGLTYGAGVALLSSFLTLPIMEFINALPMSLKIPIYDPFSWALLSGWMSAVIAFVLVWKWPKEFPHE